MRRFTLLCVWLFASLVSGQICPVSYNNANLILPLQSNAMLVFGREGDLPYFTSTLSTVPPYTSSLPQVNGNQLLEGCFAADPHLVASPASYQSGAGAQRDAVIHSADSSEIGLALVHFGSPKTLWVWTLSP